MDDCIFCKIARKEIPSSIVYEDDKVLAFKDINPVAPVHVLIIPKEHISGVTGLNEKNASVIADIHLAAAKTAEKLGIDKDGFRMITNCGKNAGQTVFHLHYHLIGGINMGAKLL
jgi:histidine triad (HIT) family protein